MRRCARLPLEGYKALLAGCYAAFSGSTVEIFAKIAESWVPWDKYGFDKALGLV